MQKIYDILIVYTFVYTPSTLYENYLKSGEISWAKLFDGRSINNISVFKQIFLYIMTQGK
jgi:hypothetical protein